MGQIPKLKVNIIAEMRKVVKDPRKRRALTPILKRPEVKLDIGKKISQAIVDRTLAGKDKNNKTFRKTKSKESIGRYAASYVESDEFKIYGKNPGHIDLKLTGEMLSAIDVHKLTANGVEIWIVDKEERQKASGHIYGDNPNKMPIRDFWDLPEKVELEDIINDSVRFHQETADILATALDIGLEVSVGAQEPIVIDTL